MNRTITLPELAEIIASATDIPRAESESFLKDLFSLIGERLADNDDVIVKGLGRFAAIDGIPAFYPDSEFADGVNLPFAAFEPIELDPAITPDMLEAAIADTAAEEGENTDTQEITNLQKEEKNEIPDTLTAPQETTESEEPEIIQPKPDEEPESTEESEPDEEPEEDDETDEHHEPEPQSYRMPSWKLLLLILLFIFWGAGCFLTGYLLAPGETTADNDATETLTVESNDTDSISVDSISVQEAEANSEAAVEAEPVPVPQPVVTDTVRRDRFLTTMAREHYGMMEFWVYIYEENADRLGDPNRIAPGTTVVIPPAAKYGIDRNSPESVQAAKLKANEIYTPYQK